MVIGNDPRCVLPLFLVDLSGFVSVSGVGYVQRSRACRWRLYEIFSWPPLEERVVSFDHMLTSTGRARRPERTSNGKYKHRCTHTSLTTHTAVLDPPLVLTAHQSPASACRNALASAAALESLSIRRSRAGSPALRKPGVQNTPTYIHALSELTSRPPHP